jgi:hypothetical protein
MIPRLESHTRWIEWYHNRISNQRSSLALLSAQRSDWWALWRPLGMRFGWRRLLEWDLRFRRGYRWRLAGTLRQGFGWRLARRVGWTLPRALGGKFGWGRRVESRKAIRTETYGDLDEDLLWDFDGDKGGDLLGLLDGELDGDLLGELDRLFEGLLEGDLAEGLLGE